MPRDAYKPEQSVVSLWPNDRKQRDTDPDLTGTAQMVDEETGEVTEYWANGWENNDGGKRPVLSIKLKRKDAAPRERPAPRTGPNSGYPGATGKRYGTRPRPTNMETWEKRHGGSVGGGNRQQSQQNDPDDEEVPF